MGIFSIIAGIMSVLFGMSCTFRPVFTFQETEIVVVIMLFVFGVVGIIRSIGSKNYGINFVFSIVSMLVGLVLLCIPGLLTLQEGMLIFMIAGWFVLQGITTIAVSIALKKHSESKKWLWGLFIGILGILLGLFSLYRPIVIVIGVGMMVGIYFIETGINLIVTGIQINKTY